MAPGIRVAEWMAKLEDAWTLNNCALTCVEYPRHWGPGAACSGASSEAA